LAQHVRELSFYLGMPAAVLGALGCLALVVRNDFRRLMLLAGVPALFNLVALGKIWQSRQLLPMTPFIAALIVLGWRHIAAASAAREGRRTLEWAVIAVCCFTWLAPMLVVRVSDGPRAPYGRLWSPVLWTRWQSAANHNQAEIRTLVRDATVDSVAILTDTWDADRYLHLALQESGYASIASEAAGESCAKTVELFSRGDRRILHIRLHQPFLPNWPQFAAARLETWARPCVADWRPARLVWLVPLEQLWWSLSDSSTGAVEAARSHALTTIAEDRYSPQLAIDLPRTELEMPLRGYRREIEQLRSPGTQWRAETLEDAERLMAGRVWPSTASRP
jgi:hypothetical protein